MKEPSNLPPGVTDRMIEEQAGALEPPTNKEKYDQLFHELDAAIDQANEQWNAEWDATIVAWLRGPEPMLDDVPLPDEDAIARRVVTEPLPEETALVAIVRYARVLGQFEEACEHDEDEEKHANLNVAVLLSWRLAVLAVMAEMESDDEAGEERYVSGIFRSAAFQKRDDDQQV